MKIARVKTVGENGVMPEVIQRIQKEWLQSDIIFDQKDVPNQRHPDFCASSRPSAQRCSITNCCTPLFMGGESVPNHAVVQSAGTACRMPAHHVRDEYLKAGQVQLLFLRYTQALITQMGQTAVCNRHHTVDQQLCRWILMSLDRLPSNHRTMTKELIANMLGVRREGVTKAAGKLQRARAIEYRRGRIVVIDRPKLETMVCECCEVVRLTFVELLPWDAGKRP